MKRFIIFLWTSITLTKYVSGRKGQGVLFLYWIHNVDSNIKNLL